MRWSCTLTLFVIEFLAVSLPAIHALPLPEDLDLFTRGNDKKLKESSKNYRDAARQSSTSFDVVDGALTKARHEAPHTPQKGQDAGTHVTVCFPIGWHIEDFHRPRSRGADSACRPSLHWTEFLVCKTCI